MQEHLQITFRDFAASEWIERRVRDEVARLDRYYPRILGCKVLLGFAHGRHATGNRFRVRIDLALAGGDIVVSHEPDLHASLQDVEIGRPTKKLETEPERKHLIVAVDEAFETARRRLQDFAARQRGETKLHEPSPRGRVVRLDAAGEYGFLEAGDGHEVYFHRNSVLDGGFDDLAVGSDVVFSEQAGEQGPRASAVRPVRGARSAAQQEAE